SVMAAIQTIMAMFKSGFELIVSSDLFGGTYLLFENEWKKYGLTFHYYDFSDEDCLRSNITPNTKEVFVETPTNPLMQEA
ncbi:PLP-dependent transferase, partial [Bacillus subtilis]|uniref:PLP-dependent transferase n=1 Tax=Bacillus subtilis TaxID=1423 RepID=UPI0024AE1D0A